MYLTFDPDIWNKMKGDKNGKKGKETRFNSDGMA